MGRQQPPASSLASLEYEIHTGRELELMLEGKKPLSVFSEVIFDGDDLIDDQFDEHVRLGTFIRQDLFEEWDERPTIAGKIAKAHRTRLYALRNEAWRIQAYTLLKKVSARDRWTDALGSEPHQAVEGFVEF